MGITLTVNGQRHDVEQGDGILLDVLRNELGIMSPRFGCGEGLCGACSVLVDGRRVTSCDTPIAGLEGREIVTVEGLGNRDSPHPLQAAFIAEQAMQCGYCTSGILIGAAALLHQNPDPDDEAIRRALDLHLCRCGAHPRVLRAVRRAATAMQGKTP